MSTRVVKLTVITDFACASCFVVQHELAAAIAHCKDVLELPLEFQFQYVPFVLLGPKCLKPGTKVDKVDLLNCHLGPERAASLRQCVTKWAEEKSIPIKWEGVKMGQTIGAHRLCQKALELGGQEAQLAAINAIFREHMCEGKDVSDPQVLADIAESQDVMPRDKALAFLESDELEAEVIKLSDAARAKGITGIPVTVIDGKWAVSGGQSSDVFIQIFKKLAASGIGSSPSSLPGPAIPTQICT